MDAAQIRTFANDWLKDLSLALKNVSLYSAEHARGREYLDRAYDSLRTLIGERREVTLTRGPGRVYLDQVLLDRDRGLAEQLAADLEARGIDGLVIHSTLSPDQHMGLIRCLLARPDKIAARGGFGKMLIDEGVSSIKPTAESTRGREGETTGPVEMGLINFVIQVGRGGQARESGAPETAFSISSVLARDPAAVVRAIGGSAAGAAGGPEAMADIIADTLERLGELAIDEHQRDREEILGDLGRAVLGADPATHAALFLEKAGPRSTRKQLVAAVESLRPDTLAELVAIHHPRAAGDYRLLTEMLNRTLAWRDDRRAATEAIQRKMRSLGLSAKQSADLIDHLHWSEIPIPRRLELLSESEQIWRGDFSRLREVLAKLLASDQIRQATALIEQYLSGLKSPDLEVRRQVADSARYVLQVIEKSGKRLPVLGKVSNLFFARLHDEQDAEIVSRLAGSLAFLADLRLRTGELAAALEMMRKAEQMGGVVAPTIRERGEKLSEALSRAGNEKTYKKLLELLLEGTDQDSMEASEILKRGGSRSANYLIEKLAEEENRSHRARLVMLLKEMGKGSAQPFVSRLTDHRWFLVRNVVGILGDIGDAAIVPHLRKLASHGDPRVRREVVRTLMRLATPECEDQIVAALADEDLGVQITAASSLATLKGRRAAGVLADVVKKAPPFERAAVEVRQEALAGLAALRAPGAFALFSSIITRRGFLGHSEPTDLRVAAVRALAALGTAEARKLLSELAQKDPRPAVRDAAREGVRERPKLSERGTA